MRALIITDESEVKSFQTILILKQQLEAEDTKVDIVTFSSSSLRLNNDKLDFKSDGFEQLLNIVKRKEYTLFVISLKTENMVSLFSEKSKLSDKIKAIYPQAAIFIFGASSIINKIESRKGVYMYKRVGVAKLIKQINEDILSYIKKIKK